MAARHDEKPYIDVKKEIRFRPRAFYLRLWTVLSKKFVTDHVRAKKLVPDNVRSKKFVSDHVR